MNRFGWSPFLNRCGVCKLHFSIRSPTEFELFSPVVYRTPICRSDLLKEFLTPAYEVDIKVTRILHLFKYDYYWVKAHQLPGLNQKSLQCEPLLLLLR